MQDVPVRAFVGVGANLGDAPATVRAALHALGELPQTQWVASSSLYRSAPLHAHGPDFINAVAELRTLLCALPLLRGMQDIERGFGRVRSFRNAPRTLDLELLLFGDQVLQGDELELPHPRAHLLAFVLLPLAELDAQVCVPGRGPIAPWLARAANQQIEKIGPA